MAATRIVSREAPAFSEWLGALMDRYGITRTDLLVLFIRTGGVCSDETIRRWVTGKAEPGAKSLNVLLDALDGAIPEMDVWQSYREWWKGLDYLPEASGASSRRGSRTKPTPTDPNIYLQQVAPDLHKRSAKPTDKSKNPTGRYKRPGSPPARAA